MDALPSGALRVRLTGCARFGVALATVTQDWRVDVDAMNTELARTVRELRIGLH